MAIGALMINPGMTFREAWRMGLASLVHLGLAVHVSLRAWRSTPAQFRIWHDDRSRRVRIPQRKRISDCYDFAWLRLGRGTAGAGRVAPTLIRRGDPERVEGSPRPQSIIRRVCEDS